MTAVDGAHLTQPVTGRDHVQEPPTAPVSLVEYGDYECPYCGAAYPIVKEVQRRLGDRLRFVFRNFPLANMHPHDEHLEVYAGAVGLDVERFDREMEGRVYAGRVREDFMSGVHSSVNGTPTFFINGLRHDASYDLETLLAAIEAAAPEGSG